MSGSEDIANIRKNTNTRTQVRNLIKEFNLSRTLSVPTDTLDYSRQQISLDGLVEITDDNTSFIGKNYIRRGYYLTFEPDIYKLQLWHKLNSPFSISVDSSLHERNGKMFGIPLPIRGPDNGLNGSVQIATGFDGINDWVDIPHDPYIEFQKVLEGFSFHIKYAPCGIDLSNGQPVTLYAKKEPTSFRGHENAIISVIMPDGSVNVKLTFEGHEYTVSAPQYHDPATTEFGISKWYDHTVTFDRINQKLELLLDNQLYNSEPWENSHITPYPYIDTDWHIARSSFDNRGLFWGGLADFRYYWDLKLSYQHNFNLFTNRISISQIPRGQTATVGFSYITHSLDIGYTAGFLRPKTDGRGFLIGHFLFLSEPVSNDLHLVYDMFALPKVDNDLPIIYDITYAAPVANTLELVYDIAGGVSGDGKVTQDLLIQYDILGTTGGGGGGGGTIPQGNVFKFNIAGDFRAGTDATNTANNLVSDTPDVIFMLGDYSIGDATPANWCNTVMAPVKNSGIPVWGCLGNHDNNDYLNTGFFQNTGWVWSVKYGNVMFISCDTIAESVTATQALVQSAQANPAIMRIVIFMHESVFKQEGGGTSGSDTTIAYHNMFKQYNKLKLVIAGHSHNYTRFAPYEGIQYIICEDGGQQPDANTGAMHCSSDAVGNLTCKMITNLGVTLDTFTIPATPIDGAGGGGGGTQPPPPPTVPVLNISVFSDGDAGSVMNSIMALIKSKNTHQVIVCGDFTHSSTSGSMSAFSGAGLDPLRANAIWCRGNHEASNEDGSTSVQNEIATFFNTSTSNFLKKTRIQNVFIIGTDTNDPNFDSQGSAQYNFILAALQEAAALKAAGTVQWIIVAGHKPHYANTGSHHMPSEDDTANAAAVYQPLFNQYGVDFVFNGHNHTFQVSEPLTLNGAELFTLFGQAYDFTKPHGQIYINDGVSGRGTYSVNSANANYRYVNSSNQGFVFLSFDATGLRCKVQLISNSGSILHEFDVVKTTTTTPPPTDSGGGGTQPPPPAGGEIDANGIKWFEAFGAGGVIGKSRNNANDFRWSENVTGLSTNGYEATLYFLCQGVAGGGEGHIALKHWGGNHSGDCQYEESGSCCCWYDTGVRDTGEVQLQTERPHPSNHDFNVPSGTNNHLYMTDIGTGIEGKYIGLKWVIYPVIAGGHANDGSGIRLKMWVDTSGMSGGRPQNQWRAVYDFIDKGEVLGNYKAPTEQEIEVRNSDTNTTTAYGGGVHWRKR